MILGSRRRLQVICAAAIVVLAVLPVVWGAWSFAIDEEVLTEEWYKGLASFAQMLLVAMVLEYLLRQEDVKEHQGNLIRRCWSAVGLASKHCEPLVACIAGDETPGELPILISRGRILRASRLLSHLDEVDVAILSSEEAARLDVLLAVAPDFEYAGDALGQGEVHNTGDQSVIDALRRIDRSVKTASSRSR